MPIAITTIPVRPGKEGGLSFTGIATVSQNETESSIHFVSTEEELMRLFEELQGIVGIVGLSYLDQDGSSVLYLKGDDGRERVEQVTFKEPISIANVLFGAIPVTVSSGRVGRSAEKSGGWKWSKNNT